MKDEGLGDCVIVLGLLLGCPLSSLAVQTSIPVLTTGSRNVSAVCPSRWDSVLCNCVVNYKHNMIRPVPLREEFTTNTSPYMIIEEDVMNVKHTMMYDVLVIPAVKK